MPHVMSAERIGMEKGMLTEARENVLETLYARFSKDIPEDVYKKILREIPPEQQQEQYQ